MESKENSRDDLIRIGDRIHKQPTVDIGTVHSAPVNSNRGGEERYLQENLRSQRDLIANMCRDMAAVSSDIKLLEQKLQELRSLEIDYKERVKELQNLSPESAGDSFGRRVDLLRVEHYRLMGRGSVLSPEATYTQKENSVELEDPLNKGTLYRVALLLAGAILCAGVVVALALFGVFKV